MALFKQHGMPLEAEAAYDASQLQPSPQPGISDTCHSCIVNFAAEGSSMKVVNDREKLAHCHACLTGTDGTDTQYRELSETITYGLASRFVGKYITPPAVRKVKSAVSCGNGGGAHGETKLTGTGQAHKAPTPNKADPPRSANTATSVADEYGEEAQSGSSTSSDAAPWEAADAMLKQAGLWAAAGAKLQPGADKAGGSYPQLVRCFICTGHMAQLNKTAGLRTAKLPSSWRKTCIDCLESNIKGRLRTLAASIEDTPVSVPSGVNLQDLAAQSMASMLLKQYLMPLDSKIQYDESKLERSPQPGVSNTCHSCIVNWVAEGSSMDVVNFLELMAHCHACLKGIKGRDKLSVDQSQMVAYGLASRLLGKLIMAPAVRQVKATAAPGSGSSSPGKYKHAGSQQPSKAPTPSTCDLASCAAASAVKTEGQDNVCSRCSQKLMKLDKDDPTLSEPHQPKRWRQDCIACLEANLPRADNYYTVDLEDYDELFVPARLQGSCAQHMSFSLFALKGMPWGSRVTADTSKLPASSVRGMSRACHSCLEHWVIGRDMAVAYDRNLLAHCHMCLTEYVGQDGFMVKQSKEAIWFALASRFVGKYVTAPSLRSVSEGGGECEFCAGCNGAYDDDDYHSSSGMHSKRRRAADDARAAGRASSHSQGKKSWQEIRHIKLNYDEFGATGWFDWVDSAWFEFWGPMFVLLLLVMSLFVDVWLSGHHSFLFKVARRLGLVRERAAAAPAQILRERKAAAGTTSSNTGGRPQHKQQMRQQQAVAGKGRKKKQAVKAGSKSRDSSSQAASRDQGIEASRDSSREQDVGRLHKQQLPLTPASGDSDGASSALDSTKQPELIQTQQQQQQQQAPGMQSSSAPAGGSSAGRTQHQQAPPRRKSSSSTIGSAALGGGSSAAGQVHSDALLAAQLQEEETCRTPGAARVAATAAAAAAGGNPAGRCHGDWQTHSA
jgi:hypothetical protein